MKQKGVSLDQAFPEVASSWDFERNGNLTPADVTAFAKKKVWWKCDKCGESWPAAVASRTAGRMSGCGYCAGKRVSVSKSFAALYPDIAKQWDVVKNGILTPQQVLPNSGRKAWWICSEGHSYQSRISGRTRGRGCPICSGNIVIESTSFAAKFPELASEWHPDKNLPLKPTKLGAYSQQKVWWSCVFGHEWQATIANRTAASSGCPYCGGQRATPTTSLLAINPDLAAEWHPTRNHDQTPDQFTANSGIKVWWCCPRGHEWAATINHRQNGSGCPFCGGGTSALEARVFTELKHLFSDVVWHSNAMGVQVDVFLPTLGIGVEVDGHYWHSEKVEADLRKNATCEQQGVHLIRLRQLPLKKLADWDVEYLRSDSDLSVIQRLVSAVVAMKAEAEISKIADSYLGLGILVADADYRKIIANLPSPPDGASFASIYPDVAAEWHEEKNAPLEPTMFAPKANREVWWRCSKKGHEWLAAIYTRATGIGCPYCSNLKTGSDNSLTVLRPDLVQEWNFEKNISVTPETIGPGSKKKVWWKCKAAGHEWEAPVGNRARGSGCPYCTGRFLTPEKSLAIIYPEIAATWDFEKNTPLRPEDVHSKSTRKVWWKCIRCAISWQSSVAHRVIAKIGCPKCSRRIAAEQMRITKLSSLGTLRQKAPEIAARWHQQRNADLTPDEVGRHSTKPVWWLCPDCGHEWHVSPNDYCKCSRCGSK